MVRFLHTADWQLGMGFPGHAEAADWLAEMRFAMVERLADMAVRRGLDLVLVAGDVFDSPRVGGARIREVCAALGRMAPIPVFLLAGNHDPLEPGGIWSRTEWADAPANVHVCGSEPIRLEDLRTMIHPCPLRAAHGTADPTAHLPQTQPEGWIHLGLAHGALPVGGQAGNHPIRLDRPAIGALDYLALGDWHSTLLHSPRVAYSGTPEPTRFGERSSGLVLVVEIPEPGDLPQVDQVRFARTDWRQREAGVELSEDLDVLQRELDRIDCPESVILELRLSGAPTLEALSRLEALEQAACSRFRHFRTVRDGLLLRPTPNEIAMLASEGPLGRAVERIASELNDGTLDSRVAGAALQLYYEQVHA